MKTSKTLLIFIASFFISALILAACSMDEPTEGSTRTAPVNTSTPSASDTLNTTHQYQTTLVANQTQIAIQDMTGVFLEDDSTVTVTPRPLLPTATINPTPTQWTGLTLKELASLGKGTLPQIVYSKDGSRIYTSDGYTVEVLDATTRDILSSIEVSDQGYSSIEAVSLDGNLFVVNSFFGFTVYSTDTGEQIAYGSGGTGSTSGPVFTKDSRFIVYRRADRTTGGPYHAICLIDLHPDEEVGDQCYPEPDPSNYHTYTDPAISPDGRWVAAGYADYIHESLYFWNLRDGTVLHEIGEQPSRIYSVAFSPDGSLLASAGADGLVRLWNPLTGTIHRTIAAFTDTLYSVDFTSDGKRLIVEVDDQPPVYYTLNTDKTSLVPAPTLDPFSQDLLNEGYMRSGGGSKLRFSPNGTMVAVGHGSIQVWDLDSNSVVSAPFVDESLKIAGLTFSENGNQLAVVTVDGDIYVWDVLSGASLFEVTANALLDLQVFAAYGGGAIGPGIGARVYGEKGIGFSPDGQLLALANGPAIEIWDIKSGSRSLTLEQTTPVMYPTWIAFSDDSAFIYAALNRNIDLAVWDAATGELIRQLDLPWVDMNAFTATDMQGDLFARNNYDESDYWIEIWNIRSGEMLRLPTHVREVEPLRFSPDGDFLTAIVGDRIYVWSTTTGDLVFVSAKEVDIGDIAIGPDGLLLATAEFGVVTLWDFSPWVMAASETEFNPPVPPPTSTPWSPSDYSPTTPTPQPTLALIPLPVPSLHTNTLNARSVSKLMMLKQIGNGVVSRSRWSASGENVFVAAVSGIYCLLPESLAQTGEYHLDSLWVTDGRNLSDGRVLLAGKTQDGNVQVWEMNSNLKIIELPGYGEPLISSDGHWLVYEDDNGFATWDLDQGKAGVPLRSGYDLSWPVFSPDSRFVAGIQSDWSVRVWDIETGIIVNGVGGGQAEITDLSFSHSGVFLVGASGGTAWVWSISPGHPPFKLDLFEGRQDGNLLLFDDTVTSVAINPDDILLAVGTSDRRIWLYDLSAGFMKSNLRGLASAPVKLSFSPDGSQLLSVDADGQLVIWDVSGEKAQAINHDFGSLVEGLVPLFDGDYAVFLRNTIRTFDPDDETWLRTTYIPTDRILAVSPAGNLAAGYEPFQVTLFDALNGTSVQTLPEEAEDVWVEYYWEGTIIRQFYGALFSPEGNRLATFGTGGIWFYAVPDISLLSHTDKGNNTRKAVFSPDGKWLLASTFENTFGPGLIDVETSATQMYIGQLSEQGEYGVGLSYSSYAFSPDKRLVAMARVSNREDDSVELVDVTTGEMISRISFENGRPYCLAFSPIGNLLAVGLYDGRIEIIDMATHRVVSEFQAHLGLINSLLFTQDGSRLITGGEDGIVKVWGVVEK